MTFGSRARGGKGLPAAAARHSKFGIPGGLLHCILFWGDPRVVFILDSRSLRCSGSCPFSPHKTRFFEKIGRTSHNDALIRIA